MKCMEDNYLYDLGLIYKFYKLYSHLLTYNFFLSMYPHLLSCKYVNCDGII